MSIVLIDTCIFCNILDVPGFNQNRDEVFIEFEKYLNSAATLLLPMAAVLETGNHIAQISNGGARRQVAERFTSKVIDAIDGNAPWTPTPFWETLSLRSWLGEFPEHAMRGAGLGDVSIIKEWEQQCELFLARRVKIWSHDEHLIAYNRARTV